MSKPGPMNQHEARDQVILMARLSLLWHLAI
jgi:hypothetical protein